MFVAPPPALHFTSPSLVKLGKDFFNRLGGLLRFLLLISKFLIISCIIPNSCALFSPEALEYMIWLLYKNKQARIDILTCFFGGQPRWPMNLLVNVLQSEQI
jgi:hypothetical protein